MKHVAAIILAAGEGVRFGACLPAGRRHVRKQYRMLRGKPILWWSLRAFQKSPSIGTLILVVPPADRKGLEPRVRRWEFSKLQPVVAGGATRADSVREGLKALPKAIRWVAVHDAARPLVRPELIEQTLREARRSRAAIAATPSKDTVKLADGKQYIASTPPRHSVWLAQTPQVFERKLLEKAHAKGRHLAVTDDAQLVERLGVKVRLVEAPPENLKVTRPADLEMAKMILKGRKN
jgi:2-C-methyl-D-erythritol 4-phosphate cytidylyltransferase